MTNQQRGNQDRGSNLSEEDRRRGGETSSREQNRDDQGQWTGTTGGNTGGQGTGQGMGTGQGIGTGQDYGKGPDYGKGQGQGSSMPRDDQGQWKSPRTGNKGDKDQSGQSR